MDPGHTVVLSGSYGAMQPGESHRLTRSSVIIVASGLHRLDRIVAAGESHHVSPRINNKHCVFSWAATSGLVCKSSENMRNGIANDLRAIA